MKLTIKKIILFSIGLVLGVVLSSANVACTSASSSKTSSTALSSTASQVNNASPTTVPSTATPRQNFANGTNPSTTAVSATSNIGIYSDAECSNPISSLNWGNLPQGTSATQTIYLENLNNQTIKVTATISSGVSSGITFTNNGPINMIPGSLGPSIYQLQMTLAASTSANLGNLNFNIGLTGATPVNITNQVNIISPPTTLATATSPTTTSSIGIYSDAECNNPISSLNWGNLPQGTSATQTVYLENLNNQTIKVTASISGASSGITFTNNGPINMIPGSSGPSIYQLQMTLAASSNAKLGNFNFNIGLTGVTPVSIASQVSIVSMSTAPSATVAAATLSSIAVIPISPIVGGLGSTQQFTATGTYSDGSTMNITSQVTWASSNTAVATITSAGLATSVAAGIANITATLSGITSTSVTLTVIAPTLSSITVIPASPSNLAAGLTQQFIANGTYSDSSTVNITSQVTWASSNTAAATVSLAGLATGVAAGSANITAALSGVTSPAVTLTVIAPTLSSITVIPASPSNLAAGLTQQFTATGTYSNGLTADITSQVNWASSDTTRATISSTGLATGIAVGKPNITATLSGLTSSPVPLTVITPISTSTSH